MLKAGHVMVVFLRSPSKMGLQAANVKVIQASDLDWTIARFPRLVDGTHRVNIVQVMWIRTPTRSFRARPPQNLF